jgi:hypothetical protein
VPAMRWHPTKSPACAADAALPNGKAWPLLKDSSRLSPYNRRTSPYPRLDLTDFVLRARSTRLSSVKLRSHHRNSRGPKIAPTAAQPAIMTPYQSAINGIESSGQ